MATGCSIDASVNALKFEPISPSLKDVDFFDRWWVLFRVGEEQSDTSRLHDFGPREGGKIVDDTQIFDTTLTNLGDVRASGMCALGERMPTCGECVTNALGAFVHSCTEGQWFEMASSRRMSDNSRQRGVEARQIFINEHCFLSHPPLY